MGEVRRGGAHARVERACSFASWRSRVTPQCSSIQQRASTHGCSQRVARPREPSGPAGHSPDHRSPVGASQSCSCLHLPAFEARALRGGASSHCSRVTPARHLRAASHKPARRPRPHLEHNCSAPCSALAATSVQMASSTRSAFTSGRMQFATRARVARGSVRSSVRRAPVVCRAEYYPEWPNPEFIQETISEFPEKGIASVEEARVSVRLAPACRPGQPQRPCRQCCMFSTPLACHPLDASACKRASAHRTARDVTLVQPGAQWRGACTDAAPCRSSPDAAAACDAVQRRRGLSSRAQQLGASAMCQAPMSWLGDLQVYSARHPGAPASA